MGYCVLGNKGQNDGNKGNGYDVEHYGKRELNVRIGTNPVNPQFLESSGDWSRDV
ncbi:MAG: hypothetical protein QG602_2863 [Verrucomicrobiota bacterium]|nr:hypothetical protein [Verrucomicrobiota bacterium]